jgi:hypothetical protein
VDGIACKRPVNTRRCAWLDMNRASGFRIPVVIFTDYELARVVNAATAGNLTPTGKVPDISVFAV